MAGNVLNSVPHQAPKNIKEDAIWEVHTNTLTRLNHLCKALAVGAVLACTTPTFADTTQWSVERDQSSMTVQIEENGRMVTYTYRQMLEAFKQGNDLTAKIQDRQLRRSVGTYIILNKDTNIEEVVRQSRQTREKLAEVTARHQEVTARHQEVTARHQEVTAQIERLDTGIQQLEALNKTLDVIENTNLPSTQRMQALERAKTIIDSWPFTDAEKRKYHNDLQYVARAIAQR